MGRQLTQAAWDRKRAAAKAAAKAAREKAAEDELRDAPNEALGTNPTTGEGSEETKPYSEWTDEELLEEFEARELALEEDAEGTRDDLIQGLEADDKDNEPQGE